MKGNRFIKTLSQGLMAVLLIMWYTLSVTGLDIHHDHEHGKTYVAACIFGISCDRIHPHSHCHDGEGGICMEDEECCSDEFHLILSQGEDTINSILHVSASFHMDFIPQTNAFQTELKGYETTFSRAGMPPPGISDPLNKKRILRA